MSAGAVASEPQPVVAIGLTPTSYLVLGMVRLGARSGYAIKKAADLSTQSYWPTSRAQVYPELARLEGAALLTRRSNPHRGRGRSAYRVTKRGERALLAWLRSTDVAPTQVRDEGILRLFFADALSREDQFDLIQRMRCNERDKSAQIETNAPLLGGEESQATHYPARVASFGADAFAFSDRWLERCQQRLEAAPPPDQPRRSAAPTSQANGSPARYPRWTVHTPFFAPDLIYRDGDPDLAQQTDRAGQIGPAESVLATRSADPIKLTPSLFLMLGMVRLGFTSGYAIKKAADASTQTFWPTSFAQLYPGLTRLQNAGLLKRRSDPQGARSRSAYSITDKGRTALLAWLRSSHTAPLQLRNEWMLRLFFADALPVADQLELIQRFQQSYLHKSSWVREQILPLVEKAETPSNRYPAVVARFGVDAFVYKAEWLARLQAQIEADHQPG